MINCLNLNYDEYNYEIGANASNDSDDNILYRGHH